MISWADKNAFKVLAGIGGSVACLGSGFFHVTIKSEDLVVKSQTSTSNNLKSGLMWLKRPAFYLRVQLLHSET